jgi:spore coat protein U-like protein
MNAGAAALNFQISNGTSCSGIVADTAIPQATVEPLVSGINAVYNICAAVIPGQRLATAGVYTDTVTVTIAAGT